MPYELQLDAFFQAQPTQEAQQSEKGRQSNDASIQFWWLEPLCSCIMVLYTTTGLVPCHNSTRFDSGRWIQSSGTTLNYGTRCAVIP